MKKTINPLQVMAIFRSKSFGRNVRLASGWRENDQILEEIIGAGGRGRATRPDGS
ncbi:hypothetical protein [Rhizobium sp. Root483D2]|uniref:hypothetical protein n=1 Tax=Rhizobium sp. Root483D2 TaxID=1736545 RepID=UPI000AB4A7E6|nr:hypothetical protein [Rhizobium sp. Root483D2]